MNRTREILVVDDDACLRELLRLHLEAAGYTVRLATDGIEAGYAILESPPDLMIVDVQMPHLNGIDLAATMVADCTIPPFPFVFLSSDETKMEQRYRLGAAAYLTKPIVKDLVLETIGRALSPRRAQSK